MTPEDGYFIGRVSEHDKSNGNVFDHSCNNVDGNRSVSLCTKSIYADVALTNPTPLLVVVHLENTFVEESGANAEIVTTVPAS